MARKFPQKLLIGFDNCAGCINKILIWTNKPTKPILEEADFGSKKSSVGEKAIWQDYAGNL